MHASDLAVDLLLGLGVAAELLCVAGVVLVRVHMSAGGLQAIATVALLFLVNPALVIATARAARRIDEPEET